jgi:hypothetical protein
MSQPSTPPPLETLKDRPFSFYPPIVNVEHNEWRSRKSTWAEILVENSMSGEKIWIPRRYLGEISRIDEPVVIVGLVKELELKGGAVWPYQRRVITMPIAVGSPPMVAPGSRPAGPGPAMSRKETSTDTRILRLIGAALVVMVVAYLLMANLLREGVLRPRLTYTTTDQSYLELRSHDDYYAVVARLGEPESDRWMSETGEIQFRALTYPQRSYTVILMGADRGAATYIGALDGNWKPVHFVPFRGGGSTSSLLRELRRF